jgi:hypothetical protein
MLFDVHTAVKVNIPVSWKKQSHSLVERQTIYYQTNTLPSTKKMSQDSFYKTNNLNVQTALYNVHKTLFHSYTFRCRAPSLEIHPHALAWASCKFYKINYVALLGRNNLKITEDDKFSLAVFTIHNEQVHNLYLIMNSI